jgi:hypothetical protein
MRRRAIALGVGVVVILVFALGINSCLDSRKQSALKDYNRNVTSVAVDSREQVSQPFFQLLSAGTKSANDLEVNVNQLRVAAEDDVRRAKQFGVPGDMKAAQQFLLTSLTLRAGALEKIAGQLRTALGDQGAQDAVTSIAAQMQAFLTSDVLYSQRVIPFIQESLARNGIGGQTIATSQSLPDIRWLSPAFVAQQLKVSGGGGGSQPGALRPGTHGHGLTSVGVNGVTLQPSPALNRISGASPTFDVKFANQGQNDEFNVKVSVTISGSGKPIKGQRTVTTTKAGAPAEASIRLSSSPPAGLPVTVTVSVSGVPGEKKTDNNRQSYTAIFSG